MKLHSHHFGRIWITDLKHEQPLLNVDGFDILLKQTPPTELCPEGCTIRRLDIMEEFPERLRNTYGIVNERLIRDAL